MAFSAKTLDFLFENRLQDSRDWFLDHKDTYQAVLLEPMKDLVRSLTPVMLEIDAKVTTEPRVDKTICRLRRDTRYSHDKSLYRDTMWLIFKRGKMHGTEVPGIYFEITCDGFNYGCGFYHASAAYMNTMRRLILQGDPAFEKGEESFFYPKSFSIWRGSGISAPIIRSARRRNGNGWSKEELALWRKAAILICCFLTGCHKSWRKIFVCWRPYLSFFAAYLPGGAAIRA